MKYDSLGDRMKSYESCSQYLLQPNSWVIARVDGRAFHTYTKTCNRPFDDRIIACMRLAASQTLADIGGSGKLAYVASDECTFLLTDTDSRETQPWFGNNLSKIVSTLASVFTMSFNAAASGAELPALATFDCRAFTMPLVDVPNMFLWRHKDWNRNSLSMYARAFYTHGELLGKQRPEMHEMLHAKGVNWADLSPEYKDGTYLWDQGKRWYSMPNPTYDSINELMKNATDC